MGNLPPTIEAQLNAPKKKTSVAVWVIAGICFASILCVGVVGAILFPVFAQAKEMAALTACSQKMQTVADCITHYAADNGKYPMTLAQASGYGGDDRADIRCPKVEFLLFANGYSYNASVYGGRRPEDIPPQVADEEPLLIESFDARWEPELTAGNKMSPRHMNGRYLNAYYLNKGVVKIKLTDAQMGATIRSVLPQLKSQGVPYQQ